MRVLEKGAPAAAILAALSTLACCAPLGFLGAVGLAGVSVWLAPLRPWLLAAAVVLLLIGFAQLYRRRNQCARRSPVAVAIFWVAVALVLLIVFLPQLIAGWLAG